MYQDFKFAVKNQNTDWDNIPKCRIVADFLTKPRFLSSCLLLNEVD